MPPPRDLVAQIPGLDADGRAVLGDLAERPRAIAELRAGLRWTRRRVVDTLATLERRRLATRIDEQATTIEARVYALGPGVLEQARITPAPWKPPAGDAPPLLGREELWGAILVRIQRLGSGTVAQLAPAPGYVPRAARLLRRAFASGQVSRSPLRTGRPGRPRWRYGLPRPVAVQLELEFRA